MSVPAETDERTDAESSERADPETSGTPAEIPVEVGETSWPGSVIGLLHDSARVERVFGDPVKVGTRTVVPVARVAYGFGGGYGSGTAEAPAPDEDVAAPERVEVPEATEGESGAGGGGGVVVRPVGAIEVSEDGSRLLRFGDRRRRLGVLLAGVVVGLLLGRRR